MVGKKQLDVQSEESSKMRGSLGGFTLVELSLSMVFIAILSIIIVLVINGAMSSYSRGITLNLVNTIGTEITEEIRTTIHEAPAFGSIEDLCKKYYSGDSYENCVEDGASSLFLVFQKGNVTSKGEEEIAEDVPIFGALCLGNYSYLWNSGYFFDQEHYSVKRSGTQREGEKLRLDALKQSGHGNELKPVWDGRLLRVKDGERLVCRGLIDSGDGTYTTQSDDINNSLLSVGGKLEGDMTEVLAGDSSVAVYDLQMVGSPVVGDGVLYSLSLTLGTVRSGININSQQCVAPNEDNSNANYCAINQFNITALASGGTKK